MERLIHNVHEDLGLPLLPVIQVAIASGDGSYMERVREAQLGICLPNVACVDAKGLPLKEDHLHLSTEAQVKPGHLLADAFVTHTIAPSLSSSPARLQSKGKEGKTQSI